MRRRSFLKISAAACLTQALAMQPSHAATVRQVFIAIRDVTPSTPVEELKVFLDALAEQHLPVTIVLKLTDEDGAYLRPESPLARYLAQVQSQRSGLIDIAPYVESLGYKSSYFRARAAFAAARLLRSSLELASGGPHDFLSVACPHVRDLRSPKGVRSAGFRCVLVLPEADAPVRTELWDDGTLRLVGGRMVSLAKHEDWDRRTGGGTSHEVYHVSASEMVRMDRKALLGNADDFARRVTLAVQGGAACLRVSDAVYRGSVGFSRLISVHFSDVGKLSKSQTASLEQLRDDLLAEGIPSTVADTPGEKAEGIGGFWISDGRSGADEAEDPRPLPFSYSVDRLTGQVVRASSDLRGPGVGLLYGETDYDQVSGVDPNGHLTMTSESVRNIEDLDRLARLRLSPRDTLIMVSADLLAKPIGATLLKRSLRGIRQQNITKFVTLNHSAVALYPRGAEVEHNQRTQAVAQGFREGSEELSGDEEAALLRDAETAWRYFEHWTHPVSGLCPATVNFWDGGQELHETVTMWDVGSHINALVAAAYLGLVTKSDFRRAVHRIMPNIAGRKTAGRLLPQGWIRTDRIKWGNRDFDGCDGGRLMAALYNLSNHPWNDVDLVKLVQSWDLKKVIQAGEIQSVRDGLFRTTFWSHCAHYAARAFRTWGMDVSSPYEVFDKRSDADGDIALLEVVAQIGVLGAEPLLLEPLEIGMSPESAYLADVLFAAQLRYFEETGQLVCVSEGAIDRAPWFTYQGLRLDEPGITWGTDTVDGLAEHRTKAFVEDNMVVSSKAAYLWAAYRPHAYSDKLVKFVRERAKTKYGFAASIFQKDDRVTDAYSDLNTNAVILQAIAEIMRARGKPTRL